MKRKTLDSPRLGELSSEDVLTAWHIAGHAVMAWAFNIPFRPVMLLGPEDWNEGDLAGVRRRYKSDLKKRITSEHYILVLLAGPSAERRSPAHESMEWNSRGDEDKAVDIAKKMWKDLDVVYSYTEFLKERAKVHVKQPLFRRTVSRVANRLLMGERISARKVAKIVAEAGRDEELKKTNRPIQIHRMMSHKIVRRSQSTGQFSHRIQ